jgi:hypothetical protein
MNPTHQDRRNAPRSTADEPRDRTEVDREPGRSAREDVRSPRTLCEGEILQQCE